MDRALDGVELILHPGQRHGWWKRVAQLGLKKSVEELLEEIASENAELFDLLATNAKGKKK